MGAYGQSDVQSGIRLSTNNDNHVDPVCEQLAEFMPRVVDRRVQYRWSLLFHQLQYSKYLIVATQAV